MLKQNQRVVFEIGDLRGVGRIVGKAVTEMPIIGASYIIEPDESILSTTYPYSHFTAFENQLVVL